MSKQGFSYIEVVCCIVILGIIIPPLLSLIINFTRLNQQAFTNQEVACYMQNMMEEVKERLVKIMEEPHELNDLKTNKDQVQSMQSFFKEERWGQAIEEYYRWDQYIYEIGIWEVDMPYQENLKDTFGEWIKLSSIDGERLESMGYQLAAAVQSEEMMLEWIRINGSNNYYNVLAPSYQAKDETIQGQATIKWFEQENRSTLIDEQGNQRQELPLADVTGQWGTIEYDEIEESYLLKIDNRIIEGKVVITIDLEEMKKEKVHSIVNVINQSNCELIVKVMLADTPEDLEEVGNLITIQNPYQETVITYYEQKNRPNNPFVIGVLIRESEEEEKEKILGKMMDIYSPKAR
ncbi:MAG: type IV pilus modification PilV family protein [Cellulosilyticaceae bacterium]